jgi:hypothetical protein
MAILVAVLLGALALAFVLYPLYRRVPVKTQVQGLSIEGIRPGGYPQGVGGRDGEQKEGEQVAQNALQEVELDFQLGNLGESDYRSLREHYTRRAFLAAKSRQKREQELDDEIEEQLRRLKEAEEREVE